MPKGWQTTCGISHAVARVVIAPSHQIDTVCGRLAQQVSWIDYQRPGLKCPKCLAIVTGEAAASGDPPAQ